MKSSVCPRTTSTMVVPIYCAPSAAWFFCLRFPAWIECISCDIYQGFFASSNCSFCIKPVWWIRLETGSKFVFLHQVELHFTLRICDNYYSLYTLMELSVALLYNQIGLWGWWRRCNSKRYKYYYHRPSSANFVAVVSNLEIIPKVKLWYYSACLRMYVWFYWDFKRLADDTRYWTVSAKGVTLHNSACYQISNIKVY